MSSGGSDENENTEDEDTDNNAGDTDENSETENNTDNPSENNNNYIGNSGSGCNAGMSSLIFLLPVVPVIIRKKR